MADVMTLRKCANCGKEENTMKCCGKCKLTFYCSRDCQVGDWKEHKKMCASAFGQNTGPANGTASIAESSESEEVKRDYPPYDYTKVLFNFDHLTGRLQVCDPDSMTPVSLHPQVDQKPMELQFLMQSIRESLSTESNFFRFPSVRDLSFITNFGQVMSDADDDLDPVWTWSTIMVAKIIKLDVHRGRHGIVISDENYKRVVVYFYFERSPWPYFKLDRLVPGNFICIHAPKLHRFLDRQTGFRVDKPDTVRILSSKGKCLSG